MNCNVKKRIQKIVAAGYSPDLPADTNRQTELCNRLSLIAVFLTITFALLEWSLEQYSLAISDFILSLVFLTTLILNSKGYLRGARYLFVIFTNLYLFYCSSVQGEDSGIYLGFFPIVGLPFLLLAQEVVWVQVFLSLLPISLFSWLKLTHFRPLSFLPNIPAPPLFFYASMITAFYLCYIFVKFVDEVYRDYNLRLQGLVDELKTEKQKTLDQQERLIGSAKMAALGEMAAGVAHEINNPLASIQLLSTQIILLNSSEKESKIYTSAEKIQDMVKRVSQIVEALRYFARKTDSQIMEKVSPLPLIEEAIHSCESRFSAKNVDLHLMNKAPEFSFESNKSLLLLVLQNLLNNALDACVEIKDSGIVTITLDHTDVFAEITVRDSGKGIPPEIRDNIFIPFYTTKTVGTAMGLGLSLSRGIVESLGGKLFLGDSSSGACFVVQLPLTSE